MPNDPDRLTQLDAEGDIAADYLEELLDIADLDGDIDIAVEHGRASVSVVSEEDGDRYLKRLVGRDGEVLDALQELTRLAVQTKTGERTRLMVDIANHRANLKAELQEEGRDAIREMRADNLETIQFEPMNPFERKVLHDVAADEGLHSESAGTDPNRYVIYSMPTTEDADSDESVTEESAAEVENDIPTGNDVTDKDAPEEQN
ncbi:MAG: R3H domain-containing nucleic acid-binding protein [Bowdeniella nasicola]|nr:R3H domain-containing nucleic acid-binding protein [Bowdeniella nasicola]